jgi:hypothetical protein
MPFEVTPFMPYLTFYTSPSATTEKSDTTNTDIATAHTDPARAPAPEPQD